MWLFQQETELFLWALFDNDCLRTKIPFLGGFKGKIINRTFEKLYSLLFPFKMTILFFVVQY